MDQLTTEAGGFTIVFVRDDRVSDAEKETVSFGQPDSVRIREFLKVLTSELSLDSSVQRISHSGDEHFVFHTDGGRSYGFDDPRFDSIRRGYVVRILQALAMEAQIAFVMKRRKSSA